MVPASISRSDFDHIEELEQEALQHVRTAGLRKPRETALAEELMVIRRERRRLFAALVAKLDEVSSRNEKIQADMEQTTSHQLQREKGMSERITGMSTSYEEKFKEEKEKLELKHRIELNGIRKKCEDKIRLIEGKLEEIMLEKGKKDTNAALALASDMTRRATKQIEQGVEKKLQDYKAALISTSAREKEAERQAGESRAYIEVIQAQEKRLTLKLLTTAGDLETQKSRAEKEAGRADRAEHAFRETVEGSNMEIGLLRDKLKAAIAAGRETEKNLTSTLTSQEKQLQEQHEQQLQSADKKIRAMLHTKDQEIEQLKQRTKVAERRASQATQLLQEINQQVVKY